MTEDQALEVILAPTECAICHRPNGEVELYSERLNPHAFSAEVFSARRAPDRTTIDESV